MLRIGPHLSFQKGYKGALLDAKRIGATTFQYFSRPPQGGKAKEFDDNDFNYYMANKDSFGVDNILCHAPYTLNPCSAKEETREYALMVFKEDLEKLEHFPPAMYNFHPGSSTTLDRDYAIKLIIDCLNKIITPNQKTTILLETMSGKGSEVGKTFEEIKMIIDGVLYNKHLGVCMDTCHIYSAGYDIVNNFDGVLDEFDKIIGLNRLKAIHLNDSKMPFNSFKDRHECIGKGTIGLEAIRNIVTNPRIKDIPLYLETPNELDGYMEEIELIKSMRGE